MINKDKAEAYYYREIATKPVNQVFILIILFILNIIAFGYFGIYLGIKTFRVKWGLIKEYDQTIISLSDNITAVEKYEPYIFDNPGVQFIDSAIPVGPSYATFITDISRLVSKNGFLLEGISFLNTGSSSYSNAIQIQIKVSGYESNLASLIREIEELDRITSILSITYREKESKNSNKLLVDIKAEIYKFH